MAFSLGVIEGFYGRQWTWAQRFALPSLLRQWSYGSYVYAPKADVSLRSDWRSEFSASHRDNLLALGAECRRAGVSWGLGLSPVGLQADYTAADKQTLERKIAAIGELRPDVLWVLFDDLPAGNPHLARNQLAVVADIRRQLPNLQLAVCPSYYSFDPILETLFGACPDNYFADLNAGLDADIDVLWTGNRVISDAYTESDMARATKLLGRKPLLWDNYPVNDGRKTSRFLHLAPFDGRPRQLAAWCTGHMINPMNQFHLSGLVLPTLAEVYTGIGDYKPEQALDSVLNTLPSALKVLLQRDMVQFQLKGLDGIADEEKQHYLKEYGAISHLVSDEICDWLNEGYRFDPACLTD
tara:strand:- start:389 stop:1450 length:1062 start_codon:yes stop_codon:yes gene_type:complete